MSYFAKATKDAALLCPLGLRRATSLMGTVKTSARLWVPCTSKLLDEVLERSSVGGRTCTFDLGFMSAML